MQKHFSLKDALDCVLQELNTTEEICILGYFGRSVFGINTCQGIKEVGLERGRGQATEKKD